MPELAPTVPAGEGRAARVPLDVNTFIGGYPFRELPHPDPEVLVRVLAREGIARAWVGDLPTVFHRDPTAGNARLLRVLSPYRDVLSPAPVIRPDWPRWEHALDAVMGAGVAAIRAYPQHWGMGAGDARMTALARACAVRRLALVLTVRFEDLRQRHSLDVAGDLSAAHVRELARTAPGGRLVVTAGGRELIEEIHWGLTPSERAGVFYDFSWVWGPPVDDLASLFGTVGPARFVYGTMWPLRLSQGPRANLALLPDAGDPWVALCDVSQW